MNKIIAWGITGAGAFLEESIEVIDELIRKGIDLTVYVSRAGESIIEMYGLKNRLDSIVKGDYPTGVIYESKEPPGYPATGRLYLRMYECVFISPASMNTIGKIVHGIADTLVTNLVMHALKTGTPVYVLPVDAFETKSIVPLVIERYKCKNCPECYASYICPMGAMKRDSYYKVIVDLSRCNRCYACTIRCPFNAIKFNVQITVKPVSYYLTIINKLWSIPGITVIDHPRQALKLLGVY